MASFKFFFFLNAEWFRIDAKHPIGILKEYSSGSIQEYAQYKRVATMAKIKRTNTITVIISLCWGLFKIKQLDCEL